MSKNNTTQPARTPDPIQRDYKGILADKRQKNGDWLVFRDIRNNNKPPSTGV